MKWNRTFPQMSVRRPGSLKDYYLIFPNLLGKYPGRF
jgi:hypothetical protein